MKILFIGASGYGNLGDEAYKQLFSEMLPEHEIMFDSPYPDIRAVEWCDYLVVGGGGLIYCNDTQHYKYMSMYLDSAISQKKKFSFVSCGVQILPDNIANATEVLNPWKKYLDNAELITIRSYKDKEILENITSNKVFYYPDLCYLIKPVNYHLTLKGSHVYVITGVSLYDGKIQECIKKSIQDGKIVYSVIMSSVDRVKTLEVFKDVQSPGDHYINRDNLTPREAARIFADAELVASCRYHGHVFARAVGCKNVINFDKRYKSLYETIPDNPLHAHGHIQALRSVWTNKQ